MHIKELFIIHYLFIKKMLIYMQLYLDVWLNNYIEANILISFNEYYFYFWFNYPILIYFKFTFFNAYIILSVFLFALNTVENDPDPNFYNI